jgi:CubicO group peptidase (beta-lactamase class C family)
MALFPYEDPLDPRSVDMSEEELKRVSARFREQHKAGAFPGGQMVVRRFGKVVLNEHIGIARGFRPEEGVPPLEVQADTPFPVLSAGKPLAAVAVALLEDRHVLDVEKPVAGFIPGFGRHGKGDITILDVLTHRSGILLPDLSQDYRIWGDREAVLRSLVDAKPVYKRGTLAYAAYEFGWILSEVFLQVVGESLADFVHKEISIPLGLPALRYGLGGRPIDCVALNYWLGKDRVIVSGINVAAEFEVRNNSIEQIDSMNPAVSMVTDAADLAAFYEFLLKGGVTHTGRRLLSQDTLQKYTTRSVFGFDRSSNFPSVLGRGFMLGTPIVSMYGWGRAGKCFGHAGVFSHLGFGDGERMLAVAIVTNGNRSFIDFARRFTPLSHGLRRACH